MLPKTPNTQIKNIINNPLQQNSPVNAQAAKLIETQKQHKSIIGKSICIKGNVIGTGDMLFDGKMDGTLALKSNSLEIGENARIIANTYAKTVIVSGELKGDVYASERVIIRKTGRILGNIFAPDISIEDGASLKGNIDMEHRSFAKQPMIETINQSEPINSQTSKVLMKRLQILFMQKVQGINHIQPSQPPRVIKNESQTIIAKHPQIINKIVAPEIIPIVKDEAMPEESDTNKSVLGEGITITGDVLAEEDILILGNVEGALCFKNSCVEFGDKSHIKAKTFAKNIVSHGEVNGNLYAREQVLLKKSSRVNGKVYSQRVVIESGAILKGSIEMEKESIDKIFANLEIRPVTKEPLKRENADVKTNLNVAIKQSTFAKGQENRGMDA